MTKTLKFKNRTYEKDKAYQIAVSGTVYWAHVQKPDKGNPAKRIAPAYSLCVVPDDEYKPLLEFIGVKFREPTKDIPQPYIQPRVGVDKIELAVKEGKKGPTAPVVVDKTGKPFTRLIGNGSRIDLLFYAPPEQYGIPNMIRVQELVDYNDENADDLTRDMVSTMYDLRDNEVDEDEEDTSGDIIDDSLEDMLAQR